MNEISYTPQSRFVASTECRSADGQTFTVFQMEDGRFGNSIVGFGFVSPWMVVDEVQRVFSQPARSEWSGIAAGMKAGAL
jgi:hypothetical protein